MLIGNERLRAVLAKCHYDAGLGSSELDNFLTNNSNGMTTWFLCAEGKCPSETLWPINVQRELFQ